jgi:hypothetical protein
VKNKKLLIAGGGVIIVLILILGCLTFMYWQVSNFFSSLPSGIAGQFGVSGLDLPDDTLTLLEVVNDIDKVEDAQILFVVSTRPEFRSFERTVDLMVQLKQKSSAQKMVYINELLKAGEVVDCRETQQDDSNQVFCRGDTVIKLFTDAEAVVTGFSTPNHFESVLTFNLRWVQIGQTLAVECGATEGFYVSEQTDKAKCEGWNKEVTEYERAQKDEYDSMIVTLNGLKSEGNLVVVPLTSQVHKAQIEMLLEDENAQNNLDYLILDAR